MKNFKNKTLEILLSVDKKLIIYMLFLNFISLVFIYSASRNFTYVYKTLIWMAISMFIYILILYINYSIFKSIILYIYIGSIGLLCWVNFFGTKKLGATRWIKILGFQFQPTEFVKIAFCIIVSYHLIKNLGGRAKNILEIFLGILPVLPLILLVYIQPDLGSTLILLFSYCCILYLSSSNIRPLLYIMLFLLVISVPVYKYGLKDYQKVRIQTFLNPEQDKQGQGWHITQSKISIGSGKIFGRGILQGSQSRLKFLPEPQTDFIFSVIAEETGYTGVLVILGIYFALIFQMLIISARVEEPFGRYIIYGIAGIFIAHILINVAMTVGIFPVTGKPLLLISYGGTSLLSSYIMLALVQNIKVHDAK